MQANLKPYNGLPVADANISIVNVQNREVWRGSTGRDGVVLAPALPLRNPEDWAEFGTLAEPPRQQGPAAWPGRATAHEVQNEGTEPAFGMLE